MAQEPPDGPRPVGEIVVINRTMPTVPALPPLEPRLTPQLAAALEAARNPHPDVGLSGLNVPDSVRREAKSVLGNYERLTEPVTIQRIFDWLSGVNAVLAAALPRGDVLIKASTYADALKTIPQVCFNADTRGEAQRTFKWFPAAAEVAELLMPYAMSLHSKRHGLERLMQLRAPDQPRERETVDTSKAEEWRAEVEARNKPEGRELKAAYATPEQLRGLYERQAIDANPMVAEAARVRLRMMGVEPREPRVASPADPMDGWARDDDSDPMGEW